MFENDFDDNAENNLQSDNKKIVNISAQPFSYEQFPEEREVSAYYYQRRMKKNKMERKIRKERRRINLIRRILRMAVIIFIAWLCYKTVYSSRWYLDPNIFFTADNKSLEILNNKIVTKNKILAALRKTSLPHVPVYKLETDEIKQNVMQLDPIENVYVGRFWFPARLQIIVEEKVPIIAICPSENVMPIAFFAKDGTLIGREYLSLVRDVKTLRVLAHGGLKDDYRNWKVDRIEQIEHFAKTVQTYAQEEVVYLDLRNPRDVYVQLKSVNVRIGILDDTAYDRIKRISSILPQVKMLDKPIKYVDLRWKDANYIKLGAQPEQ